VEWLPVQSSVTAAYLSHWFCEPTSPLALASALWFSAVVTIGIV
jgi:hypothetical protein